MMKARGTRDMAEKTKSKRPTRKVVYTKFMREQYAIMDHEKSWTPLDDPNK